MHLFLVRHGAVDAAFSGVFYGGTEVALSPLGRAQATAAARALAGQNIQAIYASPLRRAQWGADCVLRGRNLCTKVNCSELRELDRGRWVGHTLAGIQTRFPGDWENHGKDPWNWRGHQGESLGDLRNRVLRCRDQILTEMSDSVDVTVALVAHLFPIRAILADALGWDLPLWDQLEVPTGSLSLVEYRQGSATACFWGRQDIPQT